MWQYIIPAAASIFGSLLSSEGQSKANQQNAQLSTEAAQFNAEQAELNRTFSASQADRQMEFQERMSNTSYQRAVNDLDQAGLNPMLAYHQGGASSPGGASGAGSSATMTAARMENEAPHGLAQALSSGLQLEAMEASIERTRAETDQVRAQTETERDRPAHVRAQTESESRRAVLLNQQVHESIARMHLSNEQIDKVKHEVFVLKEEQGVKAAELFLKKLEMQFRELDFPEAIAQSKAWATKYGQEVRPFLQDAVKGGHSAADFFRSFRGRR